jgi:hypothetical protein
VLALATNNIAAGVKELQLMQHDPDQTDDDIDTKLAEASAALTNWGRRWSAARQRNSAAVA